MWDMLKAVVGGLWPPPVDATPVELYRHRVVVAAFCGGNAVAILFIAVIAFGYWGLSSGFAWASDMVVVQSDVRQGRGESAATEAFNARIAECLARQDGNSALVNIYSRRVFEQRQLADRLHASVPPLPDCQKIAATP